MTNTKEPMFIDDIFWTKLYWNEYVGNRKSLIKLSKEVNRSVATIHRHFTKLGLKCRNDVEKSLRYHCNGHYFDIIDTEDKAYFLGLLFSDGYVDARHRIGIALKDDDVEIIEKMLDYMESDYKISFYTNNGYAGKYKPTRYCRVLIASEQMYGAVVSHGVVPHKSLIVKPPILREDLIRHFIRGFMDGDGSIWGCDTTPVVGFTSTKEMLEFIGDFFLQNGIIKRFAVYPQHHSNTTFSLKIGGSIQCLNALNLLYDGATVYLERKYKRYLQIKEKYSHLIQ